MFHSALVREYLAGPALVRDAVEGMTWDQLRAKPIPGRWSTLEVVCHLADAEAVYAERVKRVLVENEPMLAPADPDRWVPRLAGRHRNVEQELRLIELIRSQTAHILRGLDREDFQRRGIHQVDGPVTLVDLLQRATDHIPHHVKFIQEKRTALQSSARRDRHAGVEPAHGKGENIEECKTQPSFACKTTVSQPNLPPTLEHQTTASKPWS